VLWYYYYDPNNSKNELLFVVGVNQNWDNDGADTINTSISSGNEQNIFGNNNSISESYNDTNTNAINETTTSTLLGLRNITSNDTNTINMTLSSIMNGDYDYDSNSSSPSYDEIRITQGMFVLWTVGGLLHALYDSTIWYLETCIYC
jgi:hypothetical protein